MAAGTHKCRHASGALRAWGHDGAYFEPALLPLPPPPPLMASRASLRLSARAAAAAVSAAAALPAATRSSIRCRAVLRRRRRRPICNSVLRSTVDFDFFFLVLVPMIQPTFVFPPFFLFSVGLPPPAAALDALVFLALLDSSLLRLFALLVPPSEPLIRPSLTAAAGGVARPSLDAQTRSSE